MTSIDFTITQSSIDYGRIYFDAKYQDFFPADCFGGRGAGQHVEGAVTIDAGGEKYEGNIRISSGQRISPRKSVKKWLQSVGAKHGDKAKLHRISELEYRLEYVGA